ncbi:lytic transglycosylase domain-containing protein [Pseudooceanicola aestuarii]|uniref:lytic transglycosylase domain-containing protein n=1 Tax=Pseudooceanicola aestuarii TaxID=2697319 RepID=UPI0013D660D7|nr:lytic transglycosylase domain-containing protein [Pseudooceanicola aestuarii]
MQVIVRILIQTIGLLLLLAPSAQANADPAQSGAQATAATVTPPLAAIAPRPLASALLAADRGDWPRAADLAQRDGPVASALVEWHRLREGLGTPEEVLGFLTAHGDWPGLAYLRRQSEPGFTGAPPAKVLAFFRDHPPQTGRGVLIHARALEAAGEAGEAQASVVLAWRSMALSDLEHRSFLAGWPDLLADHHAARLDMAYWRDLSQDAARMKTLVAAPDWALYQARRAVRRGLDSADAMVKALGQAGAEDPGIVHARFARLAAAGDHAEAKQVMAAQSRRAGALGNPDQWANSRRSYAREEMRRGNPDLAYELAAGHQLVAGGNFADLEWLAGYVALRKLDRPAIALTHFEALRDAVVTPISMGRANYWIGRAQEALDQPEAAQAAYAAGAAHQTSFYGLLAAEKAGLPIDPVLAGTERGAHWRDTALGASDLRTAGSLLIAAGQRNLGERFLMHLAEALPEAELAGLGAMLEDMGEPHLEVMLGKEGAKRGIVLPRHYYALHPMRDMDLPVAPEMALAIARRESEFDPGVTSHVGAGGLMQLMPGTARDVARDLGVTHDAADVLGDWAYNARLGSAYLAQLGARFDGNVVLVSAGYNAGPGRPLRWMELYGDPRSSVVDVVDWIEHIPFRETRNYVQRVAESLPVYRARLGRDPLPVPFSEELKGSSVLTLPPEREETRADD